MVDVKLWDGKSPIEVGDIVSYSSEKSIVRWSESGFCVIENANNGYCIKVRADELVQFTVETNESKIQKLISEYDGDSSGLAQYLVDNGVTLQFVSK